MFLIVGLGNPDKKYLNTYHNLGFLTVDKMAQKLDVKFTKTDCHCSVASAFIGKEKIVLAKPNTYMNRSGIALQALRDKYKLKGSEILVVVDDLDIPKGTYRYRDSGSAGTHNGLRSIVENIGTEFKRVRIGIKPEIQPFDIADYVLDNLREDEKDLFNDVIEQVCQFVLGKVGNAN